MEEDSSTGVTAPLGQLAMDTGEIFDESTAEGQSEPVLGTEGRMETGEMVEVERQMVTTTPQVVITTTVTPRLSTARVREPPNITTTVTPRVGESPNISGLSAGVQPGASTPIGSTPVTATA